MAKDKDKKGTVVKVNEKVAVYATEKAKYFNVGDEVKAHPELAKKLIKAGKATEKAPKA